jgi:NADH-quinone oxidoreductase subunit E
MSPEERRARALEIIASFPQKSSAVIPLLHLWQDTEGYLGDASVAEIADLLGIPAAEVQEVVSFYSMFRRRPMGRYRVEVCRSLSCALCGAEEVVEGLRRHLGIGPGEVTADGLFSVSTVECLARCDLAPVAQVNLHYTDRLTPDSAVALVEELRRQATSPLGAASTGGGDGDA